MRPHLLIVALALPIGLLTACSATPDASSATPDARAALLKYAQCMRSNGIAGFPDPEGTLIGLKQEQGGNLDPKSQPFIAADAACKHFIPPRKENPAEIRKEMLKFAACMRANGFPEFPDPNPDGSLDIKMNGLNSPQYQAAQRTCDAGSGAKVKQ